jgi:DNA-binding MarR family transcriptional regulator
MGESQGYPAAAVARLRELNDLYGSHILRQADRHSSGESFLLRLLALSKDPVHPSELQQRTCTSSARVAAVLGALEKKGLIAREVDQQDRRRVLVTITDEGRERAERELAEMNAVLETLFVALGQEDTEELVRLLGRLLEVFVQLEAAESEQDATGTRQETPRETAQGKGPTT